MAVLQITETLKVASCLICQKWQLSQIKSFVEEWTMFVYVPHAPLYSAGEDLIYFCA